MGKHDNMVIPRECEYLASTYLYGEHLFRERVYAKTRSGARYQLYKSANRSEIIEGISFAYFLMGSFKINKIGTPTLKSLYGENDEYKMERFDRVRKSRGIGFTYLGMRVHLNHRGKDGTGYIVGGNTSGNLDIYFPETDMVSNCHPYWELTYYDDDDNVIKCYKKDK